jgi:hypothetical protein
MDEKDDGMKPEKKRKPEWYEITPDQMPYFVERNATRLCREIPGLGEEAAKEALKAVWNGKKYPL